MNIFEISSLLVSISALLMYINFRFLKFPMTIGLMLLSLILSFFIFIIGVFYPDILLFTSSILNNIDFQDLIFLHLQFLAVLISILH